MVQCGDISASASVFEPNQQDQRRFHEHRNHAGDEFCIVFTLELTKSIEHGSVGTARCVPAPSSVSPIISSPFADVAEIRGSAGGGLQLDDLGAAQVELSNKSINCLLKDRKFSLIHVQRG